MTPRAADHERLLVARALATDAAGAEVMRAFSDASIPAILLKGATLAEWLYRGDPRPYVDTDILVAPDRVAAAADALTSLGFTRHPRFVSAHAHPWRRARDGAEVDLHIMIWGTHRSPEALWRELQAWTIPGTLSGTPVSMLSLPGRALFVALHAAQHRDNLVKPREDLRRALAIAPIEVWRGAEQLGDRLWALGELADGLLLDPKGDALVQRLPLVRAAASVNRDGLPLAVGVARLARARGPFAKARVIARALVPPDRGDPWEGPTVDGAAGRTYAGRLAWLIVRAPGTLLGILRRRRGRCARAPRAAGNRGGR